MLLPAIQYGDWRTVSRRMRKVVTQLKRGAAIDEVMTRDGMLDVSEHPGLLVMNQTLGTLGRRPSFYCFEPWRMAANVLSPLRPKRTRRTPVEEAIFERSLQSPWGTLGLLSPENVRWLRDKKRRDPGLCAALLRAALAAWNDLDAVGPRYYGAVQGKRLWSVPTSLQYVLANMGVPQEMLNMPLPPGGPSALLRYARN